MHPSIIICCLVLELEVLERCDSSFSSAFIRSSNSLASLKRNLGDSGGFSTGSFMVCLTLPLWMGVS